MITNNRPISVLVLLCVLLIGTPVTCLAINQVADPGFEAAGYYFWTMTPGTTAVQNGWKFEVSNDTTYCYSAWDSSITTAWVSNYGIVGDVAYKHSGSESLRVSGQYLGFTDLRVSQEFFVTQGSTYNSSAWGKGIRVPRVDNQSLGFGKDPRDKAELIVEELDSGGAVIASHASTPITGMADWAQLSVGVNVTNSATKKLRLVLHTVLASAYNDAKFDWDDVSLEGASPSVTIWGIVASGATPIVGATITAVDEPATTATTDVNGIYSINAPIASGNARVIASAVGYYPQLAVVGSAVPGVSYEVNFNLVPTNLLKNAGFDIGNLDNWFFEKNNPNMTGYLGGIGDSGRYSATLYLGGAGQGEELLYQWASVKGGQNYTAKCKFTSAGTLWGVDPQQKGGLKVEEYTLNGVLLVSHPLVQAAALVPNAWETLELAFATNAQTRIVRIGGYVLMKENGNQTGGVGRFDTFELNGLAGDATTLPPSWYSGAFGYVKDKATGSPIAGAVVEVMETGAKTTTNATGFWGHNTLAAGNYTFRATAPGYFTQRVSRDAPLRLDFNLVPVGDNLIKNAGFDDGLWERYPRTYTYTQPWYPWRWSGSGAAERESRVFNAYHDSGFDALVNYTTPGGGSEVTQIVAVKPNTHYTAGCKFLGLGSGWDNLDYQYARLVVREIAPYGIANSIEAQGVGNSGWETLASDFTTGADTFAIEVGSVYQCGTSYYTDLTSAVFDSMELNGPAGPDPTIAAVKALPDDSPAFLINKVVTAIYDGYFYVQETDRSAGIKAVGSYDITWVGHPVTIAGTVTTVDGEKVLNFDTILRPYSYSPLIQVMPIGLNNRSLSSGLSPVGLYMVAWGRVDAVDATSKTFAMSDGSGTSVKVSQSADYTPVVNDFVVVTGAVGADTSGPVMRATSTRKIN